MRFICIFYRPDERQSRHARLAIKTLANLKEVNCKIQILNCAYNFVFRNLWEKSLGKFLIDVIPRLILLNVGF